MTILDLTNPKILQLIGDIFLDDGVSADIVGRELKRLLDKGFDRNKGLAEVESDETYIVRAVVTALLEAAKGEIIDLNESNNHRRPQSGMGDG